MFDERHSQLVSNYAKSSDYFARNVIAPLIKYVCADTVDQWNKKARFELGKDTYALKLDGDGGYSWAKIDPKTNNFVPVEKTESQKIEKILEESLANTKANENLSVNTEDISSTNLNQLTVTRSSSIGNAKLPQNNSAISQSANTTEEHFYQPRDVLKQRQKLVDEIYSSLIEVRQQPSPHKLTSDNEIEI
jgi:hypothetical protein